ncbi:MAG TPA: GTP-binding protein, partial [Alphaproteobacteria bacterium]|nr:GTP-binding protein [Alphaproteobacteria bacterium]
MAETAEPRRAGFVAILGAPNAGKSTLVNRLVGAKVSIVSPKVQTTRARVRGIRVEGAAQLVLVDTPGIFDNAKRRLERAMVHAAWSGAQDADAILLLVDAMKGLDGNTKRIRDRLIKSGRKALIAINKIDQVSH